MPNWVALVIAATMVLSGVLSIVASVRNWPPTLDRRTHRRINRFLNRGRLPTDAADRSAAVRVARWRASLHWWVVMLVCLALMQVLFRQTDDGLDSWRSYGFAGLAAVTAALTLALMISGRLSLRGGVNVHSRSACALGRESLGPPHGDCIPNG